MTLCQPAHGHRWQCQDRWGRTLAEKLHQERRVYARPMLDEDPKAFSERFLGMIQQAAREVERADEADSD